MFNLADYETVDERLDKFWKANPDGRISTELEVYENNRFIVKAYIYKNCTDSVAFATGYAEEKVSDRGVNSNFALPNCETSSIGRALANGGFAAKGKRPSAEEMDKVNRTAQRPNIAQVQTATIANIVAPSTTTITSDPVDYWATPFGDGSTTKLVEAPATIEQAIHNVSTIIGTAEAQEVPQCKHGHMIWQEGQKNCKAWARYKCPMSGHAGTESECEPRWYNLSKDGTWSAQKARV